MAVYQAWVVYWLRDAFTCVGFVCDLTAIFALVPGSIASILVYRALDHVFVLGGGDEFRNWLVIAGTVVADAALVYLLVAVAARFARRLRTTR